jgi:isoleucyl-tRNA synthetase
LIIYSKITCQSIRWLLLIKPSYDFQLATKKMASFLSLTLVAFYISAFRSTHFERSAKNTLLATQKVVMVTYFTATHYKTMYLQLFYGYILT